MNIRFFLIITLIFFLKDIYSQEFTTFGTMNFDKKEFKKPNLSNKSEDTLELPFIEDFSKTFPYQNPDLWFDNNSLITRSASKFPPSIGAAVFDAIDADGEYYTTSYSTNIEADILTSKPINLYYPDDNTIYFSFFYQPQGFADAPEAKDSLILQFYSPETLQWENVWHANGTSNKDFDQVILQISDSKYLQKGFQFRFKNYVSLASPADLSMVSNSDFWYVDYIRLDKDRTAEDLIIHELAFQYPPTFSIDEYEMVPYEHYKSFPAKIYFNHSYKLLYRNNDDVTRLVDSVYLLFKERQNRVETTKLLCGSYNANPLSDIPLKVTSLPEFSFPITDYQLLNYDVEAVLITNSSDSTFNNRVSVHKPLSAFYAYDDGSSEAGYGVHGEGANMATVAAKFVSYAEDTLTGIQFFINKTFNNVQPDYFNLMVWDNNESTGLPGNIICETEAIEIDENIFFEFCTYYFDTTFTVVDTFYVGWRNITNNLLNVGLDLNSTANHKYYNIYGFWEASEIDGEMLVRPVFGNQQLVDIKEITESDFNIYPNPANNFIKIESSDFENHENININIYDLYGRKIFSEENYNFTEIHTTSFAEGIYILQILDSNKQLCTKKVLIKH